MTSIKVKMPIYNALIAEKIIWYNTFSLIGFGIAVIIVLIYVVLPAFRQLKIRRFKNTSISQEPRAAQTSDNKKYYWEPVD